MGTRVVLPHDSVDYTVMTYAHCFMFELDQSETYQNVAPLVVDIVCLKERDRYGKISLESVTS